MVMECYFSNNFLFLLIIWVMHKIWNQLKDDILSQNLSNSYIFSNWYLTLRLNFEFLTKFTNYRYVYGAMALLSTIIATEKCLPIYIFTSTATYFHLVLFPRNWKNKCVLSFYCNRVLVRRSLVKATIRVCCIAYHWDELYWNFKGLFCN